MRAKITFTCKDHFRAVREIFSAPAVPGSVRLNVSDIATTDFLGLGVAITPSSCYELSLMDKQKRTELLKHIYGGDGLHLGIARLCIGSSDYSAEIYSYDEVENDTALKHFSVKRDEDYVIPMIKEILEINPDLYIFASPWSPPYWMKTGGAMCGGYMREQYLDCYADYIIKFIQAYAEHGINVRAITPQNEPGTTQNDHMPACIWHPEYEAKFIVILKDKLKKCGLDVKIWMHDHNFNDTARVSWSLDNCEGLCDACDGIAFHYYKGTPEQTKYLKAAYPEKELHFTEAGPRLPDHYDTDWVKWGLMIAKTVKVGYRSFTGWNLMLDELGGPNVGPFLRMCGGFVTHDHRTDELVYSGQYKAYSHIAPFITPKSKLYAISSDEGFDLSMGSYPKNAVKIEGVLIDTPNRNKVAVLVNPNNYGLQTQIEIDGTLWYIEMQADSITTVEL